MTEHKHQHTHNSPLTGTTRSLSLLLCLGALAGVLIWAKLRLVTDIPRSAYADPKERQVIDDPERGQADPVADQDQAGKGERQPETADPESGESPDSSSQHP